MRTWKVSYVCIRDRVARMPFFKRQAYVLAESRAAAIAKVQASFGPPSYGEYRASASKLEPDCFFR